MKKIKFYFRSLLQRNLFKDYWKPLPVFSIIELLKKYIENNEDVFFIQVGANDGRYDPDNDYYDPLNPIIKKYKINGIIIEPQKKVFEKLKKTYSNYNNLILENIAIDKKTIEKDLYKISFSSARWATGLSSFSKKVIEKHISSGRIERKAKEEGVELPSIISDYITSEKVNCMTFEDITAKHNIKKIDFVLIDTEGYDFEIIKLINFNKRKPNIIIFEHKHLSVNDYKDCLLFLKNQRYVFRINSGDTIAYQKKIIF